MKRHAIPLLLLCSLLVFLGGCKRKVVTAAPLKIPTPPAKTAPAEVTPPDIKPVPETEPPPELVVPPPIRAPRAPRRASTTTPTPEPEPEAAEVKPVAPRMVPRLSAVEEDAYKEKTWSAINSAEKNLDAVKGRRLNATQQDLAAKVRGFLAQASEAIAVGDWVRALSLADKAVVLSRELVGSL